MHVELQSPVDFPYTMPQVIQKFHDVLISDLGSSLDKCVTDRVCKNVKQTRCKRDCSPDSLACVSLHRGPRSQHSKALYSFYSDLVFLTE